jgi:hypothetical protein
MVRKWQALHRAVPQIDPTTLNGLHVPSGGLLDHCLRRIHTGHISRGCRRGEKLNAHTRSESHLQDSLVRLDVEQGDDPSGALLIRARHDNTAYSSQNTLRAAERAQQHAVYNAHQC